MKNLEVRNYYLFFILFVYVLFLSVGIFSHEFWMDESQHWLIARDSANPIDLFNNYKYDGHPMLWALCLWIIGTITSNVILVQVFHGLIAILVAAILLFKAPFKKMYSTLFIFGYYPLFEYGVLSRNYALTILFFLLFCVYYKKNGKLLLPFIFLGLAANSHLFGFIFSVILGLKILYNERLRFKDHLVSTGVLALLLVIALITIKAPSDHYFYFDTGRLLDFQNNAKLSIVWWRAIVPIPDFWSPGLWNSNFFLSNFQTATIFLALISWILPLLVLNRKSGYYLVFYLYAFAIIAFCLVTGLHLSQRIGGFILFALLVLVWLERKVDDRNTYILPINNSVKSYLLYLFFSIQIISAGFLLLTDIKRPFSSNKNIYNFLSTNIDASQPIYGGLYCNYIGVNNYGDLNLHIASQKEEINYCDWRILQLNRNNSYLSQGIELMISKKFNEMILLTPTQLSDTDVTEFKIELIGHIQGGMVNNENAFIYKIRKENIGSKND